MAAMMAASTALPVQAAGAAAGPGVVLVDNGIDRLNLDGHAVLALRARRDNYNAHSFDVLSFYTVKTGQSGEELKLVPLFGSEQGKEKERFEITVGGGADCLLQDFRLVQATGRQAVRLIVAERDFGASYIAPGIVHFTYYELRQNADQVPGRPSLYFQAGARLDSRQAYCDVNEAFDRELHLGGSSARGDTASPRE
jgi:hypothetical protein